jgi:hypothetical protein
MFMSLKKAQYIWTLTYSVTSGNGTDLYVWAQNCAFIAPRFQERYDSNLHDTIIYKHI